MSRGRRAEAGGSAADVPLFRPGDPLRAMPVPWASGGSTSLWRKAVLLEVFRADQRAAHDAEVAAERARQQRIDWGGHLPADRGAEVQEGAAPEPPPAPVGSPEERRAEIARLRWQVAEASARRMADEGRIDALPGAAEYGTWSDERLAALRVDLDDVAPGDEDDLFGEWDDESIETLDVHPLNGAIEEVERAQRGLREAEAARVQAALSAWRVAEASVTGTPDAAVDGMYFRSVIMDLAYRLQVAERTASALVHGAMDLEQRLPRSWARFVRGDVPWRGMQTAHAAIDGLDEEYWAAFDTKAADALVSVAMPKLKDRLHAIRERIQATTAIERHEKALGRMGVTIEPAPDGMAILTAVLPAPEAVAIDLRLDQAAREAASAEGETRSIGVLRAHILMDVVDEGLFRGAMPELEGLAVPRRRGVQCKVGLLLPAMTALDRSDVPAELEGYGPIDIGTAKRLAGSATSWIKVLTDPVRGAVLDIGRDKYRPTDDMRALLGVLDRGGRGPSCPRPPSQTEADHLEPFWQGLSRGRTALDNLVLLSRRDHRVKTSGLWDIVLREARELAWTSFYGTRIITTVEPLEPTPVPAELLDDADDDVPF